MAERDLILDRDAFPSNTYQDQKRRAEQKERPKIEKITKGNVAKEKTTVGQRVLRTFIKEDARNIGGYIWDDVVAPSIRECLFTAIMGSLSMMLFGSVRNSVGNRGGRVGGEFRYDQISRGIDKRDRSRHNFSRLFFDSKEEADDVLDMMREMVNEYGSVTVADMYELAGAEIEPIDRKWGWTKLRTASVVYNRDGYIIDLPPTKPMD